MYQEPPDRCQGTSITKANWTMYQVFNPSEMSVTLTAGKVVATVIPIHEEIEINSISMNKDYATPEQRSPDKDMSHSSDSISFNIRSGLSLIKTVSYKNFETQIKIYLLPGF